MSDDFDVGSLAIGQRLLFENAHAQAHFGGSVFWLRRVAAFPSIEEVIAGWGVKRNRSSRGIVELFEGK
jgi:hypothetical protein